MPRWMPMNVDGVFLVDGGSLRPLMATPYETEDLLQQALVDFPEILAGRVTASDGDRPLLLIKREKGVPIADGGPEYFSIDHFFVDSEGVPVLVEVKRQSDTRIRREVVGQMLDYAANAVRYWPIDQIREDFATTFDGDPDSHIADFSDVGDVDAFWSRVASNLGDGRIRMLFVADGFPAELVRVIEFLNEQMTHAEVLGIEVRQYTDGQHQVLVPRVIGATSSAERAKRVGSGAKWDRATFFEAAAELSSPDHDLVDRLFEFADSAAHKLSWGSGKEARVSVWHDIAGDPRPLWWLRLPSPRETSAAIGIWRRDLERRPGTDIIRPLIERLTASPPFAKAFATGSGYPEAAVGELGPDGVGAFIQTVEECLAECTAD